MSQFLATSVIRNGIWFSLALICCLVPTAAVFGFSPGFGPAEIALPALVTLCGTVLVESLGRNETTAPSHLKQGLAALAFTAATLFVLSLYPGLFVLHTPFVPAVLILFVLLRCLPLLEADGLRYPAWLSTGVLVLGSGPAAETAKELVTSSRGRYRLVETREADHAGGDDPDALAEAACRAGVGRIVVTFRERRGTMPLTGIMRCRMRGITVMDLPGLYEDVTRKLYIETITPSWFIFSSGFCLSRIRRAIKRLSDLLFAALGLGLFACFLPGLALAIRLDSPGPVFFRQIRTGLGGRPFTVFKLRSMRLDAERNGAVWAGQNDPRITRLGRFLRKTRLDELPQLYNVLRGDMSLIGPRPERPEFIRKLEKQIPFYSERHCVKPGVTGWAQVRYPYGASVEDALEKLRYDLYYIKNQSFLLDMEIVLRTIGVVLLGSGAR